MKAAPFRNSEWIKHAYEFSTSSCSVTIHENSAYIITNPAQDIVKIDFNEKISSQIVKLNKSAQLYFYGLVWVGFSDLADKNVCSVVKNILSSVFEYAEEVEKTNAQSMVWDDHALSERACTLLYLKECDELQDLHSSIDKHLGYLNQKLEKILSSNKWEGNNHRVFHLCAQHCLDRFYLCDSELATKRHGEIEQFLLSLFSLDTGLSVEQSISYYNFDIILLDLVTNYLRSSGQPILNEHLNSDALKSKKNKFISALAFPCGELPASGDTPVGLKIKKPLLDMSEARGLWNELDRIGHFRGCSEDGAFHYHVLSHNGESAHGHNSPLHIDFWVEGLGTLFVDSGGPYKYGDPLRHQWFRSTKAHNTITFLDDINVSEIDRCSPDIFIESAVDRSSLNSCLLKDGSYLVRKLWSEGNVFIIEERVFSSKEWFLKYRLNTGLAIERESKNSFTVSRNGVTLLLEFTGGAVNLTEEFLTRRGGSKEKSPSLTVTNSGSSEACTVELRISKNNVKS
jgi:hypothetical protein